MTITPSYNGSEFSPFHILEGDLNYGLLIIVDHASATIPPHYASLGLEDTQFKRHIAYDIGIEGVARGVHAAMNIPVVMSQFSRLLIDPNRGEDDPTLVMRVSDGAIIPGNAAICDQEKEHRKALFHRPYHQAITEQIDMFLAADICPILISLHSFTDNWRGDMRPWHAGVLWDQDPRFVHPLLKALSTDIKLEIGDNEPYTGKLKGDCMHRHGTSRGLAHALIEIRQDLITSEEGQKEWADRLSTHFSQLIADEDLIAACRKPCHFGSYAD